MGPLVKVFFIAFLRLWVTDNLRIYDRLMPEVILVLKSARIKALHRLKCVFVSFLYFHFLLFYSCFLFLVSLSSSSFIYFSGVGSKFQVFGLHMTLIMDLPPLFNPYKIDCPL